MYVFEFLRGLNPEMIFRQMETIPYFYEYLEIDNTIDRAEIEAAKGLIKERYMDELEKINSHHILHLSDDMIFASVALSGSLPYSLYIMNPSDREDIRNSFLLPIEEFKNPLYGLTFLSRDSILGMRVCEKSIEKYGEYEVAALIVDELTSFCIDEEERQKTINQIKKGLEDMVLPCEEECYGIDEAFESLREKLGFPDKEETLEEKQTRLDEAYEEIYTKLGLLREDVLELLDSYEEKEDGL